MVCGYCTFCGLTHTTWRSGHWSSESPLDHHHFWIVPCSTIRFLWLAKVKPLPSSRNGCLRLCPRHNRRSKPRAPETKRSGPNGTSWLFSRSLTSKKNAIRTLPPLCGSNFHRRRMLPPLLGHPAPHQAALRLLHRQLSSRPISLSGTGKACNVDGLFRAVRWPTSEPGSSAGSLPDLSLVGDARSSWPHHPDEDYLERAAGRNRRALPPPAVRRPLPGSVRTAPSTSR